MAGLKGLGVRGAGSSRLRPTNFLLGARGAASTCFTPTNYHWPARDREPSNAAAVLCGSTRGRLTFRRLGADG